MGHFEANFTPKTYISRDMDRYNRGMATLQLCREVFTQRNFAADFIRLKLNYIQYKNKNRFLRHLLGLRGHVRTPSIIARWKAYSSY